MKLFLIALFFVISRNSNCQLLQQHHALPGNHSVDVISSNDSLTFRITNPQGISKTWYYGQLATDTALFRRKSFLVKEGNKLVSDDHVMSGDSILLLSIPDWNDRFFVFRFQKTNDEFEPSITGADGINYIAIIRTPEIFVNTDYNYIADFRAEQWEFFYGDVSTTYNLLELINFAEQSHITSRSNTIRMDQRAFHSSGDLSDLSERSFGKFMKKTLKQCYVPW